MHGCIRWDLRQFANAQRSGGRGGEVQAVSRQRISTDPFDFTAIFHVGVGEIIQSRKAG
jgi:hypothetical protein